MNLPPSSGAVQDESKCMQQLNDHHHLAESSLKPGHKPEEALTINRGAVQVPSPGSSHASIDSSSSRNLLPFPYGRSSASPSPAATPGLKCKLLRFWVANKGLALVLISQLFGTLMNVTTRMLEMEGNHGKGYHPFQILFARMSITVLCASLYMWYTKIEHFPLGLREVRPLLIARGLTGFFGVFGMYYSLLYLPLADATVITFLAPSLACWACSFLINEPFTRMEQIAAYISLFGVVLIARPFSLFAALDRSNEPGLSFDSEGDVVRSNTTLGSQDRLDADYNAVTPTQRATAVGIAMLGVLGAAGAYTTIRWIGKRAHPLISVNYFATWCTIVSIVAMLTMPNIGFQLPTYFKDWCYLIFLGVCGFVMQFLLATGLQYEKSSRATNMVYMQMLFALTFDKLVWGTTPGFVSILGSSLILGSAIYVAMHKEQPQKAIDHHERRSENDERGLMSAETDDNSRYDDDDVGIPMQLLR